MMYARFKKNVREVYLAGRDASNPEVRKWANLIHHLSFRLVPVIGEYKDHLGRDLVVLDVTEVHLYDQNHVRIYELTIEKNLVE